MKRIRLREWIIRIIAILIVVFMIFAGFIVIFYGKF